MNNKPILFEDKMKYRDNEFLYDKCIKQHDCIKNYQWKMREYKQRINKAIEIYKNKNNCKYKKQRFMEDKTTADLMYEAIKGSEE